MARAKSPATGEKKSTTRVKKATTPTQQSSNGSHAAVNGNVEEVIRARAYEIYESRGRQDGAHEHDWFIAEAEVRSRTA